MLMRAAPTSARLPRVARSAENRRRGLFTLREKEENWRRYHRQIRLFKRDVMKRRSSERAVRQRLKCDEDSKFPGNFLEVNNKGTNLEIADNESLKSS